MRFRFNQAPRARLILTLALIFSGLTLPRLSRADETQQLMQLLNYFSSTCPSQGIWTQNAIAQTQTLISTLQSVLADPNCQSISGALNQLQTLNTQIQSFASQTAQIQVLALQKQQQTELLQLSQENDPTMIDAIKTNLYATQASLAQEQGAILAQNKIQALKQGQALSVLVSGTGIALNQAVANQTCLLNHPGLLTGLASLAGSVASSATSSAASLGIAAATNLFNNMVEYIRQKQLAKQIHALAKDEAETAYQCVLESLSDQWCSAQDAHNLIDLKAQALNSEGPGDPVWVGATLLDIELPIFLNWLSEVQVGSPPTNDAEATRQKRIFERDANIKTDQAYGLGIIQENIPLMASALNDQNKWIVEKAAITQLIGELSIEQAVAAAATSGGTNPLLDIYGTDYAPFYLIGLSQALAPKLSTGYCSLSQFDPFSQQSAQNPCGWPVGLNAFRPDLPVVQQNLQAWISQAQVKVSDELASVLQSDALGVISDAITPNLQGRSPSESAQAFMKFLGQQRPTAVRVDSRLQPIYDDTIDKLGTMQTEISTGSGGADAAKTAISSIYRMANLSYGTTMFSNRLQNAIRLSLNALVLNGTGLNESTDLLLLTATDLLTELEPYSTDPRTNLTQGDLDVKQSQSITEKALTKFTDVFSKNITQTLEDYLRLAKHGGGEKYDESRAALCLKILAVPEWPKDIPKKYCLGSKLTSIFKKKVDPSNRGYTAQAGPDSATVTESLMAQPHEKRACSYLTYLRKAQVYQNYLKDKKYKRLLGH